MVLARSKFFTKSCYIVVIQAWDIKPALRQFVGVPGLLEYALFGYKHNYVIQ